MYQFKMKIELSLGCAELDRYIVLSLKNCVGFEKILIDVSS